MSEFVWHWTNGNKKVYTKNIEIAERAMREGMLVMGIRVKPNIVEY